MKLWQLECDAYDASETVVVCAETEEDAIAQGYAYVNDQCYHVSAHELTVVGECKVEVKHLSECTLTWYEAILACYEHHFVTHASFDSEQSMHAWGGQLYYEDGAKLPDGGIDFLRDEKWAQTGWRIKHYAREYDYMDLDKMHVENKGYMLSSGSYEEVIKCS